jgi:hypothetical protein
VECQFHSCYGFNETEVSVCSEHGICVGMNLCECVDGWTGATCVIPICYGINSTDSAVCSFNGTCIMNNTCECYEGYVGDDCSRFTCFGVDQISPEVCGGHGIWRVWTTVIVLTTNILVDAVPFQYAMVLTAEIQLYAPLMDHV